MSLPGIWELLVIAGIVLLVFGGRKLPQLGGALGESIRNFKKGLRATEEETPAQLESKKDQQQDKQV